ncbi:MULTISPECIES: hypothetical protein [unclassified Caballeronia]|uniref:hypothetical protein n=1 Tax=unclassified Caballeronia TaxID=2646786 RepID=UPI00140A9141|nr:MULTISPECIES: hypothetical protein [unclassified Caballeronia]
MRALQPQTVSNLWRLSLPMALITCLVSVFVLLVELRAPGGATTAVSLDESKKMEDCRAYTMQLLKPDKTDVALLYQVSDLCYTEVRREYLLGNFNIHRYDVVKQNFQTLVVMWMVVTITMSGVFLAGMQLLAAYRLASAGQGQLAENSDLSLERGKVSLKSSVTGLMILTVSLAFFIVYVKWVYTLTPDQSFGDAGSAAAPNPPAFAPSTLKMLPGIGHAVDAETTLSAPTVPASGAAGVSGPVVLPSVVHGVAH